MGRTHFLNGDRDAQRRSQHPVLVVERVEATHERVTITRNGRAAAVLISPEDLDALEETLDVLQTQRPCSSCVKAKPQSPLAMSSMRPAFQSS